MQVPLIIIRCQLYHNLDGISHHNVLHQFIRQQIVRIDLRWVKRDDMPEDADNYAVFVNSLIAFCDIEIFFYRIWRIAVFKIQFSYFGNQAQFAGVCFSITAAFGQFFFKFCFGVIFLEERDFHLFSL